MEYDKAYVGSAAEAKRHYGTRDGLRAGSITSGLAQPGDKATELETVLRRIRNATENLWRANGEMTAVQDRIRGGVGGQIDGSATGYEQRAGMLGQFDAALDALDSAVSEMDARAAFFSRMA